MNIEYLYINIGLISYIPINKINIIANIVKDDKNKIIFPKGFLI